LGSRQSGCTGLPNRFRHVEIVRRSLQHHAELCGWAPGARRVVMSDPLRGCASGPWKCKSSSACRIRTDVEQGLNAHKRRH
jgi:hypothetical protein